MTEGASTALIPPSPSHYNAYFTEHQNNHNKRILIGNVTPEQVNNFTNTADQHVIIQGKDTVGIKVIANKNTTEMTIKPYQESSPWSSFIQSEPPQYKISTLVSLVMLIATVTFFIFCLLYTTGAFHFERFVGPIGPAVTLPITLSLILLSASLVYIDWKKGV